MKCCLAGEGRGWLDVAGKSGCLGHLAEASCLLYKMNWGPEGHQGP